MRTSSLTAAPASLLALALLAACAPERPLGAVCLEGAPFIADGPLPVSQAAPGDAHEVRGLHHDVHPGCERVIIDLAGQDGTSALFAGQVQADVHRDLGVVRVSLLDIDRVQAEATDATFGGPLARSAYAVRSPDGPWIYVDVHLGAPAEAHVALIDDPARIAIDLRPGGGPVPAPPARFPRTVVLSPRSGNARYPLTVTGYARTFEANVVARLEQDAEPLVETFTTATGYVDAWGHYTLTIDEGPTGPVTLHVGEYSARDGTWEGVAVELTMREE